MTTKAHTPEPVPQDLHIHTVFSAGDGALVCEQTIDLVAAVRHARVLGVSDHFELLGDALPDYRDCARGHGLYVGTEIGSPDSVREAVTADLDYYIVHCEDTPKHYAALEQLVATGRPVIIAHPMLLDTNLDKAPPECLAEVNNRYVWRDDWRTRLGPYVNRLRWVISSDAHQPHWLNQNTARWVAAELGIVETLLFDEQPH